MAKGNRSRYLLLTLFLGVLMAALDIAILGPAIPAIRQHFGVDDRTVAWAFNTFVFFNLLGVPLMTKLADVFGRRRVYMVDISLFAVGALIVALAPNFETLLVGRGFQGLAASGIFPVAAAVVGDQFESKRRGRALGILGAVFGIAFIIGPILAGVLLTVDWRLLYVAYLPLAVVVLVMAYRQLPDNPQEDRLPLDWPGLLILGTVLVSLAYGVNRIDTADLWTSLLNPRVWLPAIVVVAGIPLFLLRESRAEDPVVRLGLFRSRQVVIAALLAVCAGLNESAFIFLPALAIAAFGVSPSDASFMLLPLVTAVAITSPVAGRILDRTGSKAVIIVCQLFLVAGMATVALGGEQRMFYYAGSVLIGAGLAGILGPSLSYILINEARVQERAVSQGLITLFISMGQLVGGAAIGAVAASAGSGVEGYEQAFIWIAGASGIVLLLALGLKGRTAEMGR